MTNYPIEIARLRLEEVALKYGKMCEDCSTHQNPADQRKAYDGSLEIALHQLARSLYATSKSTKTSQP